MNLSRRIGSVRLVVAAQLAAVMLCAWYWHHGYDLVTRAAEGPMEWFTILTALGLPLSGLAVPCLSTLHGWRLVGFLGIELGLGIAFLIAMLPTFQ